MANKEGCFCGWIGRMPYWVVSWCYCHYRTNNWKPFRRCPCRVHPRYLVRSYGSRCWFYRWDKTFKSKLSLILMRPPRFWVFAWLANVYWTLVWAAGRWSWSLGIGKGSVGRGSLPPQRPPPPLLKDSKVLVRVAELEGRPARSSMIWTPARHPWLPPLAFQLGNLCLQLVNLSPGTIVAQGQQGCADFSQVQHAINSSVGGDVEILAGGSPELLSGAL